MNASGHAASLAPSLTLPWPLPPVLLADNPNTGPAVGGNTVNLTGLGLNSATQVLFGTAPATVVAGDVLGFNLVVVAPPGDDPRRHGRRRNHDLHLLMLLSSSRCDRESALEALSVTNESPQDVHSS
uniref:IPT/TIG domain-containing protein n=1 Tax=Streptomyces novaecaesareae TaxID=68244 RepID=UPI000524723B